MEMFILVTGGLALPFVFLVQPLRMLWGVYRIFYRPAGRYLNIQVLLISLFIKTLSLLFALYLYWQLSARGYGLTDRLLLNYMILPFIIYLMSELVARHMHRASNEPL